MTFQKIDRAARSRAARFEHSFSQVPCTYSRTVKLDVTGVGAAKLPFYPALLYCLTAVLNRHGEFRTAFNARGELGVYGEMLPCYTVFHRDAQTFSERWTPWDGADLCGQYRPENGAVLPPLSVQVHHAVCDGFHVGRFVRELQELLDHWDRWASPLHR